MSRITPVSDQVASQEASELFSAIKAKVGMVPNLYRVAAQRPAVLSALLGLGDALTGGDFDATTREAIALAVANANGCDYCASAHSAIASSLKVSQSDITGFLNGTAEDPRRAAILELAIAIVQTRGLLDDAAIDRARAAGLSDGDIVETLSHTVANIFTNYLNHVADTEIDFPVVRTRP